MNLIKTNLANTAKKKKIADFTYDGRFNFRKYRNNRKSDDLSITSKFDYLKKI